MTLFKRRYRIETARLRGWNYGGAGWYFVTICTRNRQTFFGVVENGVVRLSPIGEIARDYWAQIPHHMTANVAIDAFVVMPNHIHGIVAILESPNANVETLQCNVAVVETLHCNVSTTAPAARDPDNPVARISPRAGSLGAIIRSYKSAVSYWCHHNGYAGFGWQARFYDRIIRNERALRIVRRYIARNPAKWKYD